MRTTSLNRRLRTPAEARGRWVGVILWLGIVIGFSGCGLGEKRTYVVRQYILESPSPVVERLGQTSDLIKIERFSVAQAINTTAMLYQDTPNILNSAP